MSEPQPVVSPGRARTAAIGVTIFCAALPLQWQALVSVPGLGTLRYFHIAAVVMIVLARPTWQMVPSILRRSRPVGEGMVAFIACNLLTALAWNSAPSDYVQRSVYFVLGIVGGACLFIALADAAGRRVLLWTSAVTIVSFCWFFYRAMVTAHVNPVRTIERAVVSGDPSVIEFSLFRSSFNSTGGEDVRSNARHEIFAALIVVLAVSLVAGAVNRSAQIVLVLSGLVTVALVFISQSRSDLLAVLLALLIPLARVLVTRRIRAGTILLTGLIVATGLIALPTVGSLILTRVTQTKSYDARIGAFNLSSSDIVQRLLFGGPRLDVSTHNLVGDGALRGGLMGGIGAVLIVLGFALIAFRSIRAFFRTRSLPWFAAVLVMTLALVRCFTAGGGQLQLTEWFGVGLAVVVAIRAGLDADAAEAEPAAVAVDQVEIGPPPPPRRDKISAGR